MRLQYKGSNIVTTISKVYNLCLDWIFHPLKLCIGILKTYSEHHVLLLSKCCETFKGLYVVYVNGFDNRNKELTSYN